MANPEHLAKLKEGVQAWNEWRNRNPEVAIDLTRADFRKASLTRANLAGADLHWANLAAADLEGADLRLANLILAHLENADLRGADFTKANLLMALIQAADLRWADLSETNLTGVDLPGTNLTHAILSGADLTHANVVAADFTSAVVVGTNLTKVMVGRTKWCDVDLSRAVGLESTKHYEPSSVGIDTLFKSKGRVPDAFLRGCGLADWEIEATKLYDPSLREDQRTGIVYEIVRLQGKQPVMFYSVFISYSTSDEEFAAKLHGDLQSAGVRCWFAPHDIASGKKLHEQIDRAIQVQDRLLLILSEGSMSSEWVKTEIANARAKEREQKRQVLFPIRLVSFDEIRDWKAFDADMGKDSAREIREYFIPDFSNWKDANVYKYAFDKLLKDLRARDEQPSE
jgi:hypothetical protein